MGLATPLHVTYDGAGNPVGRGLSRLELRSSMSPSIKEFVLQQLIDQHPEVLPLRDFLPAANTVCSLGREVPVELSERPGERRGFIDNLLVTDDGHLVLVETKLWRNPESVRQVIAQVMEYSMAIGGLGLEELEQAIRQGDPRGHRLKADESVADRVRSAMAPQDVNGVIDDFEDAFARFRQTGELLVLIVADGIQTSIERLSRWFGTQFVPGSPVRLGLVELRFYDSGDGHMVFPVTLLRTKELGRHTVVVELKEGEPASVISVSVLDAVEDRKPVMRQVRSADAVLTKESFLERARLALSEGQFQIVQQLIDGLEKLDLATRGTPTTWQYGVLLDGVVLGIVLLFDRNIWCQIPARLRAILGPERFVECKRILNTVAPFYREEDVGDPEKVNALTPRYDVLTGRDQEFLNAIRAIAAMAKQAIVEVV